MALLRCALLLIVSHLHYSESGGHGGKKHDIIKIHIPEIINHERHTKHVTIHHHHPSKKEHHHHHHHHAKPELPKHWEFHEKKIHKSHSHGSDHYGGITTHNHGHKDHGHDHFNEHHEPEHHDPPKFSHDHHYTPVSHEYTPPQHKYTPYEYTPSKHKYTPPSYSSTQHEYTPPQIHDSDIPGVPKLYGVKHTFKQVQFFDSVKPASGSNFHPGKGYQVTEQSEDEDEGNSINSFVGNKYQPIFGADFGYTAQLSSNNEDDPFAAILAQNVMNEQNVAAEPLEYDPSPKDTEFEYSEGEPFSATHPGQTFAASRGEDEHKDSTFTGFSEYPLHVSEEQPDLTSFHSADSTIGKLSSNEQNYYPKDDNPSFGPEGDHAMFR